MKAFVFSLCVLTLLITLILVNAAYVARISAELQSDLQALPQCSQANDQVHSLLSRWKDERALLQLSVGAADITELENHLSKLCVAASLNNEEAFEEARALCLLGLTRIHDLERFSFLHIL